MPGRIIPLVTNQIYHVFNRGIDHRRTFTDKREYKRAIKAMSYYRFVSPPFSLSSLLRQANQQRDTIFENLERGGEKLVDIISFCLMPNHFHLLLRQDTDEGIAKFISTTINSYTRFFNLKNGRTGPLFLDQFKGVRIETDEQLLHVSRYIHLNPYTSFVVKKIDDLKTYPWSSIAEYLVGKKGLCNKQLILSIFGRRDGYEKFLFDQVDYKQSVKLIGDLTFDEDLTSLGLKGK